MRLLSACAARSLEESDGYNAQINLDVFREDPDYQENEKKYEVGGGGDPYPLEPL